MPTVRRLGTASNCALVVLAFCLVATHTVAPGWAQRMGLDFWNLPALRDETRAACARAESLGAAEMEAARRVELANHLAVYLADGRLPLAEAVDQLEPLLRDTPGYETVLTMSYRRQTFRHDVARYAIDKVQELFATRPAAWAAVSARLEAEYAAMR